MKEGGQIPPASMCDFGFHFTAPLLRSSLRFSISLKLLNMGDRVPLCVFGDVNFLGITRISLTFDAFPEIVSI